jgi:hypothetical protein
MHTYGLLPREQLKATGPAVATSLRRAAISALGIEAMTPPAGGLSN